MNEQSDISKSNSINPSAKFRRALPIWVQLLVMTTLFGTGYVFGAMVTTKSIHSRMDSYRSNAPIFAEDIVSRLRFRLNLSDEQSEAVRVIVEKRHVRLIEVRQTSSQAMHDEFNTMELEIANVLDEIQAIHWRVIASTVRSRFLPPNPGNN